MIQRNLYSKIGKNHTYTMLNASHPWYRKVDNTFAIPSHDLEETLQKLNNIDENIEFAVEKRSKKIVISGIHHNFK